MARILILVAVLCVANYAEASGRGVTFPSLDGTALSGELFEASSRPAPAVVLVHMLTRHKDDWGNLPDRLEDAGITALTLTAARALGPMPPKAPAARARR